IRSIVSESVERSAAEIATNAARAAVQAMTSSTAQSHPAVLTEIPSASSDVLRSQPCAVPGVSTLDLTQFAQAEPATPYGQGAHDIPASYVKQFQSDELTCNTKFYSDVHLMLDNLYFAPGVGQGNPEFMTVEIKVSKTDPFRLGQTIKVRASNSPLCPVLAMKKYLLVRKITGGPLFVHVFGKPLTKQTLTAETRILLN
ncbi:Retrovirus-related Pol poly from transposon 412, partial [Paramuricea clavata]